jgi:hypothetical protein
MMMVVAVMAAVVLMIAVVLRHGSRLRSLALAGTIPPGIGQVEGPAQKLELAGIRSDSTGCSPLSYVSSAVSL